MNSKWLFLLVVFVSLRLPAGAQLLEHRRGEILVQLKPASDTTALLRSKGGLSSFPSFRRWLPSPAPALGIHRLQLDPQIGNEQEVLHRLRRHPLVRAAQFNHWVEQREITPNDPLFWQQWPWQSPAGGYGGIGVSQSWHITTGGASAWQDTIVVALIDNGVDTTHPDLAPNLWRNHQEIPGNLLDDDANGYVDDYRGWNVQAQSDYLPPSAHGTRVAGLLGARGDNNLGVTGLNWQVKVLPVVTGQGLESDIIAAYAYALEQRKRYNESQGAAGAFIVATNTSWGVDGLSPTEAPLWCAVYDSLGTAGILNVAATANQNWNVDLVGDMPTGCQSEYLIAVTATNQQDQRTFAAYGPESIDLAAPGAQLLTTSPGGAYLPASGTSFATPLVAGAIALLYAAPCPRLSGLAHNDPGAAALLARTLLMAGVDPIDNLTGEVASDGRLNVFNSLLALTAQCLDCPTPLDLTASPLNENDFSINWHWSDEPDTVVLRWRAVGEATWQYETTHHTFLELCNLTPCTSYEFQLRTICSGPEGFLFSPVRCFRTAGCCPHPDDAQLTPLGALAFQLDWATTPGAYYRVVLEGGGQQFQFDSLSQSGLILEDLLPCTPYQYRISTLCADQSIAPAPAAFFQTSGCGACHDHAYCTAIGGATGQEWIERVVLGELDHTSGPNQGYGNFTGLEDAALVPGAVYPIQLQPGFGGYPFPEYFRVWIDFNQDGNFTGPEEKVFDPGFAFTETVFGQIAIPDDAQPGETRMRVVMRWTGSNGTPPGACPGHFSFGEVEDYCLRITSAPPETCPPPQLAIQTAQTGSITISWTTAPGAEWSEIRYRALHDTSWNYLSASAENELALNNLTPCTFYLFEARTFCDQRPGKFSEYQWIRASCIQTAAENNSENWRIEVGPVPAADQVWLSLDIPAAGRCTSLLYGSDGRRLVERRHGLLPPGKHRIAYPLPEDLPSGIYFLQLQLNQRTAVRRIIIP